MTKLDVGPTDLKFYCDDCTEVVIPFASISSRTILQLAARNPD